MERKHFPLSHSGELVQQALSAEQERERLARWLRNGELYDDWEYGTEPIPGDRCWARENSDHETNAA